ncbi:MAG: VanZ family protein [Planctomycetaceae bacterium]|nr:VanZ family protein [Planctomycetaceae bacterium]
MSRVLTVNRYTRLSVLLLAAYWPLLLFLFHVPMAPQPPREGIQPDKTVHFIAYGGLAFLFAWVCWPWGGGSESRNWTWLVKRVLLVFAAVCLHGLLDEWTQPLTGRAFDWYDLQADAIGAVLGLGAFVALATQPRLSHWTQW